MPASPNVTTAVHPVKRARLARGLSVNKLYFLTGVAWKTIDDIEKGKHKAHRGTLMVLAEALDVPVSELES